MSDPFEPLFGRLQMPEVPEGLEKQIIGHLRSRQRRSALIRSALFLVGFVFSLAALVPAFQSAWGSLSDTGFLAYLSLAFSDTGSILSSWGAYLSALLEALPILNLIVLFAVMLALLESVRFLAQSISSLANLRRLHTY
jgi:hypothetical protein